MMDIDHLYICVKNPNEITKHLVDFGMVEGKPNTHPGQGTANKRFFFRNMMLELLFEVDEEELKSDRTIIAGLYNQFYNPNRSRIGIILRPSENENKQCNFNSNIYKPVYLPDSLCMNIATGLKESEPNVIFLNFAGKPIDRDSIEHIIDGDKVTHVTKITLRTDDLNYSDSLKYIVENSNLNIVNDSSNFLEIELNNCSNGKEKDFNPILPLRIKW